MTRLSGSSLAASPLCMYIFDPPIRAGITQRSLTRQSRSPPILPLSITISHFPVSLPFEPNASTNKPETRSPTLSHALAELLPISVQVPLTLSALNAHAFRPTSVDEDLHAGFLQLPAGTVILAAEVGVEEGKLEEKGALIVSA